MSKTRKKVRAEQVGEHLADKVEKVKEALEGLGAASEETRSKVEEAVKQALAPTPKYQELLLAYRAIYGQDIFELESKHAVSRTGAVGAYLASRAADLDIEAQADVLFPFKIGGKFRSLEQVATILVNEGQVDLSEQLIADLRRVNDRKVARGVLFSFCAHHVRLVRDAKPESQEPPSETAPIERDPSSSWAESGAPVPDAVSEES